MSDNATISSKRLAEDASTSDMPKKARTEGYSANRLAIHKKSQADRTACSKLRTKLRATPEFAALLDVNSQEAFLSAKVADLMEARDEKGISSAALERELIASEVAAKKAEDEAAKLRLRSALEGMSQSDENLNQSPAKALTFRDKMANNIRKNLEPIIQKHTRIGVLKGLQTLQNAGSSNAADEHTKWVQENVENPEELLEVLDDTSSEISSNSEAGTRDSADEGSLEVVISSDEEEVSDDDLDSFVDEDSEGSQLEEEDDKEGSEEDEEAEDIKDVGNESQDRDSKDKEK